MSNQSNYLQKSLIVAPGIKRLKIVVKSFLLIFILLFLNGITNQAKAVAISISPSATSICPGSSITFTGAISGASGLTTFHWKKNGVALSGTGSSGSIASPGNGSFTFTTNGFSNGDSITCYITESSISFTATSPAITITVKAMPAAITGPTTVGAGGAATLSDATTGGTWITSDTTIAIADSVAGTVTGVSAGTCTVTYNLSGCYVSARMKVIIVPAITGKDTICTRTTTTLHDAVTGGKWNSSNTSVATVGSTSGVVTGVAAGTAIISYKAYGTNITDTVTVNTMPTAITGIKTVGAGGTTSLSDEITGGAWVCSDTTFATISSLSGVVTGVSAGTCSITYNLSGCLVSAALHVVAVSPITGRDTICAGTTFTWHDATTGGVWTSANASVARTSSTTGVVTGVAAGTAIISYKVYGTIITTVITVNTMPAAITGGATVGMGGAITLGDPAPGGAWTSSITTAATIDSLSGLTTGVSVGSTIITYNLGGCYVSATLHVVTIPAITGQDTICTYGAVILHDATTGGAWSGSNPSVATVGAAGGLLTGVSPGTEIVSYTVYGATVTTMITVKTTPAALTGGTTVGTTGAITLGEEIPGGAWTSSKNTVASVGSLTGLVNGVSVGSCVITYNINGCYATARLHVVTVAAITGTDTACTGYATTLNDSTTGGTWSSSDTSVAVVDSSTGAVTGITTGTAIISYTVYGSTVTMTVPVYSTPLSITGATTIIIGTSATLSDTSAGGAWTSSDTTVATAAPLAGIVSGVSAGTCIITYNYSGCYVSAAFIVINIPAIADAPTVCAGTTITLSDSLSGGAWGSSNTSVATVDPSSGVVTGIAAGTVIISYSIYGNAATVTITVNALPSAITGSAIVGTGGTDTLSDTSAGGAWTSSDTSIATADPIAGVVAGVSAGACTISYNLNGCYISAPLNVINIPAITGAANVCSGAADTLSDSLSGGRWNSGNTSAAIVDPSSGVVTGIAPGTVIISYTIYGSTVTNLVTINALPPAITGGAIVGTGGAVTLSDPAEGGAWTSSNTVIATAGSFTGVVTGVSTGSCTISYNLNGCYISAPLAVIIIPAITGNASVCTGAATTLSNALTGGAWSSGNTSVATVISSTGVVTGISAGTAIISYTIYGATVTTLITVNAAPSAITGGTIAGTGGTITLSGPAAGGVWTSSKTTIATVGSLTGVVTGVAAGTCNISYNLSGCYVSAPLHVINIPAITGTATICASAATTLSNTVSGGTWSSSYTSIATVGSSAGTVTGISAGTTIISYLVYGVTVTKTVTVITMPGTFTGATTMGTGGSVTYSDTTAGGAWISSKTTIATVGSLSGVVTGIAAGSCTISYNISGCYVSAALHVINVSAITGAATVCTGAVTALNDATTGGNWTSSDTSITTIDSSTGTVTGIDAGTSTISYQIYGVTVTKTMMVHTMPSAITGPTVAGTAGAVTLNDTITGGMWTSSKTTVATVGSITGVVTGVVAGTCVITYNISGCYVSAPMHVINVPAITGTATICTGAETALSDATTGGVWSSGTSSVASVDSSTGTVTGIVAGTSTISYQVYGSTVTKTVMVSTMPAAFTAATTIGTGGSVTYSDTTAGGVWISSKTTIAAAGSLTGVITGVAAGTCVISYKISVCYVSSPLNVITIPAITGTATICAGAVTALSNTVSGGAWSSGNTSVATVDSSAGTVTGVAAGTAIISYIVYGKTVTKTVTVHTTPSAISGATTIGKGGAITFSDPTSGGAWTSSATSVATVISLTGVVTGVSVGTCVITYKISTCYVSAALNVINVPAITGTASVCIGAPTTLSNTASGGTWHSSNTSVATVGSTTGVVTGIAAGTVSVTYTMGGTAVITLTVLPLPSVSGTVTNVSCYGYTNGHIDISITGGSASGSWPYYTQIWSNGDTTYGAWGLSAGSYSVVATDPDGCSGTASFTVAQPDALTGSATVTNNTYPGDSVGAISYTVTGGTGSYAYSWSNGATTQDISTLPSGTYYVTATDSNGCQVNDNYTVSTESGGRESGTELTDSAIKNNIIDAAHISAYPNPFTEITNISFTTPADGHTIVEIFNAVNGEKIETIFNQDTKAGTNYNCILNGEYLSPGMYMYKISSGNAEYTGKVVFVK